MIKTLITSETRIKLLLKFFLNPDISGYLRQLADEFGESTNGIRLELNKMAEARLLTSEQKGRNIFYKANMKHALFDDIRNIVLKSTGIDKVISNIIKKVGNLNLAFIRGDYAKGVDSGLIELVIVGENLNSAEIERVREKTEQLIERKIAVLQLNLQEYETLKDKLNKEEILILYGKK